MSKEDLFIVDNSSEEWTGLRYLAEWTEFAKSFDIATGYFEIGALLALDGKWQNLDKIRILMGDETTARTKKLLVEAIRNRATAALDGSLEAEKTANPFLNGVDAIRAALESGKIECRAYGKDKFHAKTYITHGKADVIGSQALVGSSNFTKPGLTQNIELNIKVESSREVTALQEWFEEHWEDATEVTDQISEIVTHHVQAYSPFEVYAKALQAFFRGHELTASEWDESQSEMYQRLDDYQREAYGALMKIASAYGGAFLCDGVGLGKTFVGLMLIERFVKREGKKVILFAPKAAREGVWEPHLAKYIPEVGGGGARRDFSNLVVFNHTDLTRTGDDLPERFKVLAEEADVVLIDEAHHFRNRGREGDPDKGIDPSRYYRLFNLLDPEKRPKKVFFMTATPINNRLSDFRNMAELFTRRDEAFFARALGVNNLTSHFSEMEKALAKMIAQSRPESSSEDSVSASDYVAEAREVLATDKVVRELVVQRSRAYATASQKAQHGDSASFPDRKPPKVAEYSIRKSYESLLTRFEDAFAKKDPLFTLPMYYPLAWYKGGDNTIDPIDENRQKQVVGLIRTNFLKRFESSVSAFEMSCQRMLQKLLAFVTVHAESDSEKHALESWRSANAEAIGQAQQRQLDLYGEVSGEDEDEDEDIVPPELLDRVEEQKLDRDEYDVPEMLVQTFADLDEICGLLSEVRKLQPNHDDKLNKLKRLLKQKDFVDQKVLIFTEFSDTARYLKRQLQDAEIENVAEVDSGTKGSRAEIIRRFAPYYNGSSSGELKKDGEEEIRILISTDVLSEGLNLQDACRMINYDIHWNPVRLMQRIGRVDRRMNPEVEKALVADHPDQEKARGTVWFWNFLPPGELNSLLSLYKTVTRKTLLISETLGIEGKKLLTPDDEYDALKEFNAEYEGSKSATEEMHLKYQELLRKDPELDKRLRAFPGSVFSGRKRVARASRGVFFCYALPALGPDSEEFTEEAGHTGWYLYDMDREAIFEDAGAIDKSIASKPSTPRKCKAEQSVLLDIRRKVESHIKNTYLKAIDAPIGVGPRLVCWMELAEN